MVSDKKSQNIIAFLLLIMFIISFLAYQNYRSYSTLKSAFIEEKKEIESELDRLIVDYDEALSKKTRVSIKLNLERDKVLRLKDSLKELKEGNYKLFRKFRNRIVFLEDQNKALFVKVDSLNNVNRSLKDRHLVAKQRLDKNLQLTEKLVDDNTYLKESKKNLENTIAKAQSLEIENFSVVPMKKRRNGKYTTTSRFRRVSAFKISLDIAKNEIAKTGERKVFLQIVDTHNNIISANGNATLKNNTQITYSDVFTVHYRNEQTALVSFVELEKGVVEKGEYTINAYLEGELAGSKKIQF